MITHPSELKGPDLTGIPASEVSTFIRDSRANPYVFFGLLYCFAKQAYKKFQKKRR